MVAQIQRIPGLTLGAAPGLTPQVSTVETRRIAALPGLVHYFEPGRLSGSPLSGLDRATPGNLISATNAALTVAEDEDYNDEPVLDLPYPVVGGVVYDAGACPTGSFTAIIAADFGADIYAANPSHSNLLIMADGSTVIRSFRYRSTSGGQFLFTDNYPATSAGNILADTAYYPTGDVPAVFVVSYDEATRMSYIGLNSAVASQAYEHTTTSAGALPDSCRLYLGSGPNASVGWSGRIASALILDRCYHIDGYQDLLAREVAAMMAKFGIS